MGTARTFFPELESLAQRDPLVHEVLTQFQSSFNKSPILAGTGSPLGVVAASPGSIYVQRDGPNAQAIQWVKNSGNDATGWVQLGAFGSTPCAGTSKIIAISTTTSVTFYWDGTNGSSPLDIHRANGTDTTVSGHQTIKGLTAGTTYFFYPYYDENSGEVRFVTTSATPGTKVPQPVGSPPYAFTSTVPNAAQQTAALGTIALSNGSCQVATTSSGTASNSVGGWTNGIYINQ